MPKLLKEKIKESIDFLNPILPCKPDIAIVLGSGLGNFAGFMNLPTIINTTDIPHYPQSTVPGHQGRWFVGGIDNVKTLVVQGRVHYYEGYSLQQVTYPVHLMASLGIKVLILTTACGSLNPDFNPGDLMLITNHINFGFGNPLIGNPENQLGPRFPSMSQAYDQKLLTIAKRTGMEMETPFQKGVYCWVTGPNYETAAEVKMLRKLGGDAVSMSTVPEVIVARQRHLRVLGISLITNQSTGLAKSKLTHKEVTEMAHQAGAKLATLLKSILKKIDKQN